MKAGTKGRILKSLFKKSKIHPVMGQLETFLVRRGNAPSNRKTKVFHPSELSYDPCYRAIMYSWLGVEGGNIPPLQTTTLRIFDNGHYMHERYQRYFKDMGVLWGNWKCKSCSEELTNKQSNELDVACVTCGEHNHFKYTEVPIEYKKKKIFGHADGILITDDKLLLELKSMRDDLFKRLNAPLPHHLIQAMIYLFCARKQYFKDLNKILFIYENKNDQRIKAFVVAYSENILKDIFENISLFAKAWKKKKLLSKICDSEADGKRHRCPFVETCFDKKKTFKKLCEK